MGRIEGSCLAEDYKYVILAVHGLKTKDLDGIEGVYCLRKKDLDVVAAADHDQQERNEMICPCIAGMAVLWLSKEAVPFCLTITAHFRSTSCISQVNKWSKHSTRSLQLLRESTSCCQNRRKRPYPLISVASILLHHQTLHHRCRRANVVSRHSMGNKISNPTQAPRAPPPSPPPIITLISSILL